MTNVNFSPEIFHMDPASNMDYKTLISALIKKQLVILGPNITFSKVKNVPGLTIDQNGEVLGYTGDPRILLDQLTNEFVALSSTIVKQTLDSIHQASQAQAVSPQNKVNDIVGQQQTQGFTRLHQPENQNNAPLTQKIEKSGDDVINFQKAESPKFTIEEIEKLNEELEKLNLQLNTSS